MYSIIDHRRVTLDPPRYPAFYSVMQFCPDRFRAESVNVGLVVLCPQLNRLFVRTTCDNARVLRLFRAGDDMDTRINLGKRAAVNALRTMFDEGQLPDESALRDYAGACANDICFTLPRLMVIQEWDRDVEAAYKDACADRPLEDNADHG